MGKSKMPSALEVAAAVRLAWEAAELRSNPQAQGRHLVDGMAKLIGGDIGFYSAIADFVPSKLPRWLFAATGSEVPRPVLQYFACTENSILDDPVMDLGRTSTGVSVLQMCELLAGRDPTPYSNVVDLLHRVGHRDALIGLFRRKDASAVTALSVHRTDLKRVHNARERSIVLWITRELRHLYETGRLDPTSAGPFDVLSPRLRQVAEMLLTSESQKQIARTLRLSQYTVRDYVKQVYRRLGVESRAEIMSRYTASISK